MLVLYDHNTKYSVEEEAIYIWENDIFMWECKNEFLAFGLRCSGWD